MIPIVLPSPYKQDTSRSQEWGMLPPLIWVADLGVYLSLTPQEKSTHFAKKFRIETRVDILRGSKYILATFPGFYHDKNWRRGMKKRLPSRRQHNLKAFPRPIGQIRDRVPGWAVPGAKGGAGLRAGRGEGAADFLRREILPLKKACPESDTLLSSLPP